MARFRKIDPRIWNDAKFSALSNEAKLLFLYLLTSPQMTLLGAIPLRASGVAEELQIDQKRYAIRFAELSSAGIAEYDERGLFWVKNFLRYNAPDNPKVVISWASSLDLLPECPLLGKVLKSARDHCLSRGAGFEKAFLDGVGKRIGYGPENGIPYGMANKEQEKEQEQEQELIASPDGDARGLSSESPTLPATVEDSPEEKLPRKAAPVPYEKIVELYNSKLGPVLGMCRDLNERRRRDLKARWADVAKHIGSSPYETGDVLEGFGFFFDKIARSDFLMGRKDHGTGSWRATFDWLIKSSNYLKIYEGMYENGRR